MFFFLYLLRNIHFERKVQPLRKDESDNKKTLFLKVEGYRLTSIV